VLHVDRVGTNTYLIGEHNPYILVDTGEGKDAYIPLLQDALQDPTRHNQAERPHVSDIILTHKHHDHCNGLPSVLSLLRRMWSESPSASSLPFQPPRIHKFPLPVPDARLQSVLDSLSSLPAGSFVPTESGSPAHELHDSQIFPVTTSDTDSTSSILNVIHTPGHTVDSLCLYYPADRALFTADTVLGHGSSVFEDLGTYMSSLHKMIDYADGGAKYGPVYPGHGPVVEDGLKQVTSYLKNRLAREDQILKALQQSPPNGIWTTWSLVSSIYGEYPKELWEGAARSIDMHLRKLEADQRVVCQGGDGKHCEWELV